MVIDGFLHQFQRTFYDQTASYSSSLIFPKILLHKGYLVQKWISNWMGPYYFLNTSFLLSFLRSFGTIGMVRGSIFQLGITTFVNRRLMQCIRQCSTEPRILPNHRTEPNWDKVTEPNCTEPNLYRTMYYRNSTFWRVSHGRLANISDNICSSGSFQVKKCQNSTFSENELKIFFISNPNFFLNRTFFGSSVRFGKTPI